MVTLRVGRLLDEPELSIFDFLPPEAETWTPGFDVTIYVVRSAREVLYVGKSEDCCFSRLRTHLGHSFRGRPGVKSQLGLWIERHLPEARDWTVELYSTEETKQIIPRKYWDGFVIWSVRNAEAFMIQALRPALNVQLTSRYKR